MTAPYVMAIRAGDLFADRTYQRDVDMRRVRAMAADYDPRLLGVIDVSKRPAAAEATACRCSHSLTEHSGDLAPQCHARGCMCLRYRAAAPGRDGRVSA